MNVRRAGIVVAIASLAVLALIWNGQSNPAGKAGNHTETPDMVASESLKLYAITLNRQPTSDKLIELEVHGEWVGALDGARALVRGNEAFAVYLAGQTFVDEVTEDTADRKWQPSSAGEELSEADAPDLVTVTLTVLALGDKDRVVEAVLALGGCIIDGADGEGCSLLVEVDRGRLDELAESPWIIYIEEYERPSLLNDRIRDLTGSRPLAVPGFVSAAGLTGKGQSIGLADSGLDRGTLGDIHPDLRDQPSGSPKVIMLKSWVGVENPADNIGHGTHMAATMVGSGAASNGEFTGLAPGASLYFQGIVDSRGQVLPPVNIADLFRPAYAIGARIHVNGWGRPGNRYGSVSAQVDDFIRDNPEFVAIFGAGNDGPKSSSLTLEANSKNALVVGASPSPRPSINGSAPDLVAPTDFSSRGPAGDGRIKPDLLAPGEAVISAASGRLTGNLPDLPAYTMMEGTSMSAAVMGGLVAQLRQYLAVSMNHTKPSAALIKALLINGARIGGEGPDQSGFGVVDLGRTVLSLEEETMKYEEHGKGLRAGQAVTSKYDVATAAPFKVTLAWTDPAALPGTGKALINDLDVSVVAPDGRLYHGNGFLNDEVPDRINNVEQVYIPRPAPGTYTITVTAQTVLQGAAVGDGQVQDYALAYGQPIVPGLVTAKDTSTGQITLQDGKAIDIVSKAVKTIIDDRTSRPGLVDIYPGARVYLTPDKAYFVSRQWHASGIKARETTGGLLFTALGKTGAGGGFLVNREAGEEIKVNGVPYEEAGSIPPGGEISAWLDPLTQTIWQAAISYEKITGFVEEYKDNQIKLINDNKWRKLAPDAAVMFEDKLVHTDPADISFASGVPGESSSLMPGVGVRLVAAPSTGEVQAVIVERTVVFNRVERVENGKIIIAGNKELKLFPGANIKRDYREVVLAGIQPGDHLAGLLLPDSDALIALWAYSDMLYGVVSHYSSAENTLYINTPDSGLRLVKLSPDTVIHRWGTRADNKALAVGVWVRLALAAGEEYPRQVDVAEALPGISTTLAGYDAKAGKIITTAGEEYPVGKLAVITRAGYPILPEDLLPGEVADISAILGSSPASRSVTGLRIREAEGAGTGLTVSSVLLENSYWITGHTTGTKLYLWEGNRLAKKVVVTSDGRFALDYLPEGGQSPVAIVAVGNNGSVAGVNLDLRGRVSISELRDIDTHWAGAELRIMAQEGLIAGFPDGTFRPSQPVTRAEFTVLLARAFGWYGAGGDELTFKDKTAIPQWAGQSIAGAASRGIVAGYPDGSFRPGVAISRQEQCAILARVMLEYGIARGEDTEPAPFTDRDRISAWALADVDYAYGQGIMIGKDGGRFMPDSPTTRAETAVAVYRLLNLARQQER